MKRLSKREWIAVGVCVAVVIVFFNRQFFYLLAPQMGSQKMNNQEQALPENPSPETVTVGGLSSKDLVIGRGKEVAKGSIATVNYLGTFTNGVKFDSSYDSGKPIQFSVGARQLIPGFDDGVVGMKVGGKRELTIPPNLAYGVEGRPPLIPPNSTLIFTVEVVDVK